MAAGGNGFAPDQAVFALPESRTFATDRARDGGTQRVESDGALLRAGTEPRDRDAVLDHAPVLALGMGFEFDGRPHLHMAAPDWQDIAEAIDGWLDGVLDAPTT